MTSSDAKKELKRLFDPNGRKAHQTGSDTANKEYHTVTVNGPRGRVRRRRKIKGLPA